MAFGQYFVAKSRGSSALEREISLKLQNIFMSPNNVTTRDLKVMPTILMMNNVKCEQSLTRIVA